MTSNGQLIYEVAQQAVFFGLMTVCTYTDIAKDKVYNWATLPALGAGIALWCGAQGVERALVSSVMAAAVGGGLFFLLFLLRVMGAGDVKLMAALGALMGWRFLQMAILPIAIIGALMGVGMMIYRGRSGEVLKSSAKMFVTLRPARREGNEPLTVPYGAAIAIGSIGTWITLLVSNKLQGILL